MSEEFKKLLEPPKIFNPEFESVPKDYADAFLREVIGFIPVIGDLFMLYEALKAFSEKKSDVGAIYLLSVLPGPPLPLTHFIVHEMKKRRSE
jgi:hypothetical protein